MGIQTQEADLKLLQLNEAVGVSLISGETVCGLELGPNLYHFLINLTTHPQAREMVCKGL